MGTEPLLNYVAEIGKLFKTGKATEHTYRAALETLVAETTSGKARAINEPRRVACGAPDLIVEQHALPLGHIECKDVDKDLDDKHFDEQFNRYREALRNLVISNYLEFRWYVNGEHRETAKLAEIVRGKIKLVDGGVEAVAGLLGSFLVADLPTIGLPDDLADRMAGLARAIRHSLDEALRQEQAEKDSRSHLPEEQRKKDSYPLLEQVDSFRQVLLEGLTVKQFSDMYAQTLCYGMFAARVDAPREGFTRYTAFKYMPAANPFLKKMFKYVAEELDTRIAWAADDLAELLRKAEMDTVLQEFMDRKGGEDPVVHFYETFLKEYDPKLREMRGVYYTPQPVVSYIVRSIDYILKTEFGLPDGLADRSKVKIKDADGTEREVHRVQILDPACGTGSFLFGVIDVIRQRVVENQGKGAWPAYVREHLLERLHGFELLMAPYAIAHLKLGMQLKETGYEFSDDERLGIYLTNTLEAAHEIPPLNYWSKWVGEEAKAANRVKQDLPIMVILGNPPYSNFGQIPDSTCKCNTVFDTA